MIVVIDHFDSFVETLARYVREAGHPTQVVRQNAHVKEVLALKPDGLILSPGPGRPENTGLTRDLLAQCHATLPILGVCLGHQTLAHHFGAIIHRAREPRHGKPSDIHHQGHPMFDGLASPFQAGRYHALIVDQLPSALQATAHSALGEIMGFAHVSRPVWGMQFHPESVLTPNGRRLICNFLQLVDAAVSTTSTPSEGHAA